MTKGKPKGNKYDAPFMNIDKKTANKIWNQGAPKAKTKKSGQK